MIIPQLWGRGKHALEIGARQAFPFGCGQHVEVDVGHLPDHRFIEAWKELHAKEMGEGVPAADRADSAGSLRSHGLGDDRGAVEQKLAAESAFAFHKVGIEQRARVKRLPR